MFNILQRKTEEISRTTPGFEETERKTPVTGKILLLFMFVAGIYFGWRALDDLSKIPNKPEPLSSCSYCCQSENFANSDLGLNSFGSQYSYPYWGPSEECVFNQIEKDHNIPQLFEPRKKLEQELKPFSDNLNSVEGSLAGIRSRIGELTGEYSVGLQEKQSEIKEPLFPTGPSAEMIASLRVQEADLLKQKVDLDKKISAINKELEEIDNFLKEAYRPVFTEQNSENRWYEFKVFLLQFIFIIPFFFLVLWGYLRLHRKNSPYTIILTAMTAVASILVLRVILFWFWGLFLARVLEVIIKWFGHYQIFQTILFYVGMLLSFAIFGGAVYFLQKKIFDPRRVTIRRFRAKQCPHCQTNLDLSVFYCPNCGAQLKEKCLKCNQARFIGLPNCPYCGDKKQ